MTSEKQTQCLNHLTLEIRKGKKKEGRIIKKLSGPSVQHRTLKKKRGSSLSKRDPFSCNVSNAPCMYLFFTKCRTQKKKRWGACVSRREPFLVTFLMHHACLYLFFYKMQVIQKQVNMKCMKKSQLVHISMHIFYSQKHRLEFNMFFCKRFLSVLVINLY